MQRDHLRSGPLKEFFVKIGGLTVVGPSTMEPFSLNLFTLRAKGMYWSLCQIFGEDAKTTMPTHYMLMIAHILNPSLAVTFDFTPYLTDAIHARLIGIKIVKVDIPFGSYSLLMHMLLFKGAHYFAKEMDLVKEKDGEEMLVQLWSIILSWDKEDASYLKFLRCFASRLRILLCPQNPRIPKALLEFLRPKEFTEDIKIVHNWGDIYLYLFSNMFRFYGFRGTPYLLPYQVPLKIGIAKVLRQIGGSQEAKLMNRGKGTVFPTVTIAHQFVITKGGWKHFNDFFQPYRLSTTVSRFIDPKDFFNGMFRKRVVCKGRAYQFHFHEDLIKNEFNLDE